MTKASRPIASAALVLACVLLPAGFLSHGHDDRDFDGHDHNGHHHDCIICCLRDHSTLATAAGSAAAVPGALAPVAASACLGCVLRPALDPRLARGPPA